jgi:hypothetical protein
MHCWMMLGLKVFEALGMQDSENRNEAGKTSTIY